jgi:quinol monooxygenase YgiN
MGVIFAVIKVFPSPRQHAQTIEILKSVQSLTWPSAGCMGCWLSEEDYQQPHIRYTEQWQSDQALEEHLRSDLYRRVLAAMELSKQEPEVAFYFTEETRGFDLIEEVRGDGKANTSAASY